MKGEKKAREVARLLGQGEMAAYRKKNRSVVKPPKNGLPETSDPPYDSEEEAEFAEKPMLLVALESEKI